MARGQQLLAVAFRQAVSRLEPGQVTAAGPATVRAWLILHQVLGGKRWLDIAEEVIGSMQPGSVREVDLAPWLLTCCEAWVLRATGPFRARADDLARRLEDGPASTPALLAKWRISGDRKALERGLQAVPDSVEKGDLVGTAACWTGYQATASDAYRNAARSGLADLSPATIPIEWWPLAADLLDWSSEQVEETVLGWDHGLLDPALVVRAAAAIALPPLELWIDWWFDEELREGIVAEAATYPYPALRLRFRKLPQRDQVRFTPVLEGEQAETLHDAAVVSAHLERVLEDVDFSLLRGAPRRPRTGGR